MGDVFCQRALTVFPLPRDRNARKPDAGRSVAPLARPGRLPVSAQIRPVIAGRIEARVSKAMHSLRGGEFFVPRCRGQRRERVGKAGSAVRHAVERSLAHPLPDPTPAVFRPSRLCAIRVLATLDRATEHIRRFAVPIERRRPRIPPALPLRHPAACLPQSTHR